MNNQAKDLSTNLSVVRQKLYKRILANIQVPEPYAVSALERRCGDLEACVLALLTIVDPSAAASLDDARLTRYRQDVLNGCCSEQQLLRLTDRGNAPGAGDLTAKNLLRVVIGPTPHWEPLDSGSYEVDRNQFRRLDREAWLARHGLYADNPCRKCGEIDVEVPSDTTEGIVCVKCKTPTACPNCQGGLQVLRIYSEGVECGSCGAIYERQKSVESGETPGGTK